MIQLTDLPAAIDLSLADVSQAQVCLAGHLAQGSYQPQPVGAAASAG
jgi:hypothetical protein